MAQLRPDLDVNQIISVFIIKAGILLLSPRKVIFFCGVDTGQQVGSYTRATGAKGNGL